MPSNCVLEIEDITMDWLSDTNMISSIAENCSAPSHLMNGIDSTKRAYDYLEPEGWFEQIEQSTPISCDDGRYSTTLIHCMLANNWRVSKG